MLKSLFESLFRIKNSFVLVLVLIQILIITLAALLTRVTLKTTDAEEAEKRQNVTQYVHNAVEHFSSSAEPAVLALEANGEFQELFAAREREQLLSATAPVYSFLKTHGVKQFQFTLPDFKVFLRVHNPAVFGDDVTTSRPTLVECITQRHLVSGLEQGRSGYGFRAVAPVSYQGQFQGCMELGSDLERQFLETLNANYPGKWAIINLQRGLNLTRDVSLVASLNEPKDSDIFSASFSTPGPILKVLQDSQSYFDYHASTEEMALYIPIKDFKGTVALYVRYTCHTPYYSTVRKIALNAIVISLVGMGLTGFVFNLLYRGIRNPVYQLVRETEKIKNFDLKGKVEIKASLLELETLIKAVADMKVGLQSFQKYVPANLVRQLIETHQEAAIGGKLKELTVLFSDIADFTSITENLPPTELTLQLSEYFDHVTQTIMDYKGTVDKYIGDSVMAFWGAPFDMEDHAAMACRAAIECQRRIKELSKKWRAEGKYAFNTRIGVTTGEIIVGNVGSEQRLNYTVIGDPVNLASRLESLNKEYRTGIIISEDTYERCKAQIEARLIDFVVVKGKTEPVRIYELIGEKGDISPKQKESIGIFNRAIGCYLNRDWDEALRFLAVLSARQPDDYLTELYIKRCLQFKAAPPELSWAGHYNYDRK